MEWLPSTIYNHAGLSKGLEIMNTQGVAGMFYYLGKEGEWETDSLYRLTNVATFLVQSMKETIKYDACSENSWDNFGGYPLSNSCGQLGQSYQVVMHAFGCYVPPESCLNCQCLSLIILTSFFFFQFYCTQGLSLS